MKGYLATLAIGLQGDPIAGSLSSSLGMHGLGETLLARRRGWGSRRGSPEGGGGRRRGGGGVAGGRVGVGQRLQLWGHRFLQRFSRLLWRQCSLERLDGGISGEVCAGKRTAGVS
jgi:hypothetical protein